MIQYERKGRVKVKFQMSDICNRVYSGVICRAEEDWERTSIGGEIRQLESLGERNENPTHSGSEGSGPLTPLKRKPVSFFQINYHKSVEGTLVQKEISPHGSIKHYVF